MARHPATEMITPSKKQKIFYEIQWSMRPEGSKIQARYFRQACIRRVWASGMELLAKENKVMRWNLSVQANPKDSYFR